MMTDIPRSHPSENVMMISHHFPHLQTLFGLHPRLSWEKTRGKFSRQHARTPGGVLEVYMTGGCDVFFWVENLHARYFFGSRDLSRIFLGLKKICVFFWVLSPSELFVSGFRCDQWIRKIFIRTFF